MEQYRADALRAHEESSAGKICRRELARLGLPQPADLDGIDLVEEIFRVTALTPEEVAKGGYSPPHCFDPTPSPAASIACWRIMAADAEPLLRDE